MKRLLTITMLAAAAVLSVPENHAAHAQAVRQSRDDARARAFFGGSRPHAGSRSFKAESPAPSSRAASSQVVSTPPVSTQAISTKGASPKTRRAASAQRQARSRTGTPSPSAPFGRAQTTERKGLDRGVLSLIVQADDPQHTERHINQLLWLAGESNVAIGAVLLAGMPSGMPDNPAPAPVSRNRSAHASMAGKLTHAGLSFEGLTPLEKIVKRLKITRSPTWIVRAGGKDYVYEGLGDPRRLFTRDGRFLIPQHKVTARE